MNDPRVYFVGAGPGAADLLTLRAVRILARADVVLHDALVDPAVLELAPRAARIAVGKRAHQPSTAQRFINKTLVDCARKSSCVVRLKGGDPSIFGRLDEEMQALHAAGIGFEVVPGITAASAAAAELQASRPHCGRAIHAQAGRCLSRCSGDYVAWALQEASCHAPELRISRE